MLKFSICLVILISLFSITTNASEEIKYTNLHIVDINNPLSLEEIKSRYNAYDAIDGVITDKLQFETDYDVNSLSIGTYDLFVYITNSSGNTTSVTDQILVRDFVAPKITLKDENITIDVSKDNINELILNNTVIEDDYYDNYNIVIVNTDCLNNLGHQQIQYYVEDISTNKSNIIYLSANLIESIRDTTLPLEIKVERNNLNENDIASLFLQHNPIEKDYTKIEVQSNYFYNPKDNNVYETMVSVFFEDETCNRYRFKLKYEAPLDEEKTYKSYIPICIISIGILIGLIIYKKRSN